MKDAYPYQEFQSEADEKPTHQFIECVLGCSEKCQILEAINLTLFNLNNENMDQNLKKTGHQLLILIAGTGSFKINAEMLEPTKSRALLGGTPITIVSFAMRPPFQTPLMIRCCTYKNPFETHQKLVQKEVQRKKGINKFYQIPSNRRTTNNFMREPSESSLIIMNDTRRNDDELFSVQSNYNVDVGLSVTPVDEDEGDGNDNKAQKKFFCCSSWIEIVYLFDMRLIESNLFLQSFMNIKDNPQPIDALHLIDKCLSLGRGQEQVNQFLPQAYF
jgi:hypothetical protein